jgi:hypothetical protein
MLIELNPALSAKLASSFLERNGKNFRGTRRKNWKKYPRVAGRDSSIPNARRDPLLVRCTERAVEGESSAQDSSRRRRQVALVRSVPLRRRAANGHAGPRVAAELRAGRRRAGCFSLSCVGGPWAFGLWRWADQEGDSLHLGS